MGKKILVKNDQMSLEFYSPILKRTLRFSPGILIRKSDGKPLYHASRNMQIDSFIHLIISHRKINKPKDEYHNL